MTRGAVNDADAIAVPRKLSPIWRGRRCRRAASPSRKDTTRTEL